MKRPMLKEHTGGVAKPGSVMAGYPEEKIYSTGQRRAEEEGEDSRQRRSM